ncbi:hypothetical protein BU23DRAFT_597728 [Bimuria novae-zelandiae CBS 107.79]|uniref:Uncharacterized protein n=1 Tax=Bimuria novae-zelandiae CBS 107.79 TaxID=1447943 RepID=A0A6A5VID8_9PLEO|nr:hypothetical protein BU23DRAFT_597728 [Bimuria novae-zelandiae CBS 107.79]
MSASPRPAKASPVPPKTNSPRSPPAAQFEEPQDKPPEEYQAASDEDEIPYPEPASEQSLLPPPNFKPFFTVIDDSSTGEHYHPFVHYVFADDDPVIVTAAAMRSLGLDDTKYLPQPEQEEKEQDNEELEEEEQEPPVESPLPLPLPATKERFIIVDVAADGQTIIDAQSMSPDWQITNASTQIAPSFDESSPDSGYMLQIEGLEVPRKSKGKSKGQPGESKLREAQEASQGDIFGALDSLVTTVDVNLEVVGKIARRQEDVHQSERTVCSCRPHVVIARAQQSSLPPNSTQPRKLLPPPSTKQLPFVTSDTCPVFSSHFLSSSNYQHHRQPPTTSTAMLLLAVLTVFLSAFCVAAKEECCRNLADYVDHGNIQVRAVQYLLKGSTLDLEGDCLNQTCQPTLATPLPVDVCRGIFNITTSPSSSVIAEIWLPDELEKHLQYVGNKHSNDCIDYDQMIYDLSLGFATVGVDACYNRTSTGASLDEPEVITNSSQRVVPQAIVAGWDLVKQYYAHNGCRPENLRPRQAGQEVLAHAQAAAPAASLGDELSDTIVIPTAWERYNHPACWIAVLLVAFCIWVIGLWCHYILTKPTTQEKYRRWKRAQELQKGFEKIAFKEYEELQRMRADE